MSRTIPVRRAMTVASLLVLVGCSKGKEGVDSAAVARDSVTPRTLVGATPPGAAPAPPALPGALARPLEQYTPDQFFAFASALPYGGGGPARPRKCKGNPQCQQGGKQTTAQVDAVDGQDSLSAGALTANGVIAARGRNTGAFEESRYGMKPGPFEYFLIVYPAAAGAATWRMAQVDTTAGARTLTPVDSGAFVFCGHRFRKGRLDRAGFYTCANSPHDTPEKMGLMQGGGGFTDPVWVACSSGCCTFGG